MRARFASKLTEALLEPLVDGETDGELIEDLRTAWLLLHEAARFRVDLDVPLTLAG